MYPEAMTKCIPKFYGVDYMGGVPFSEGGFVQI